MPKSAVRSDHLLLTARGEGWLGNFDGADRGIARDLASALNLVSHNEFERGLTSLLRQAVDSVGGPVALYAARELLPAFEFASASCDASGSIDATPRGADIGSEGRVASVIRNLSIERPAKILNHPTLKRLRDSVVDAVIVVDDFIGSGKRCTDYLDKMWEPESVKSWVSYKRLQFIVVAYSATMEGCRRVEDHRSKPMVKLFRHCPTVRSLHWKNDRIEAAMKLCRDYAKKARLGSWSLGFQDTASLLVFEHGCPNNAPAIFWATAKGDKPWVALFPAKRIDSSIASAFPSEVVRRDPVHVLLEAGQRRLAITLASGAHRPLSDEEALVLALFAHGRRRTETIANAIGLPASDAAKLLESCIGAGWISARRRITDSGLKELAGLQSSSIRSLRTVPRLGADEYHPVALRDRGNG